MNIKKLKGPLMLLIASLIWGTAFVAQKMGGEVEAFTFLASRSYVGFLFILGFIFILNRKSKKIEKTEQNSSNKSYIKYGIICGSVMFLAAATQQMALSSENATDAGKAGFLTALYIIFVPLFGLFMKKKVPIIVWLSILIAGVGTYMLSVKENFTIEQGDILVIICAVFFSFHIISIDMFVSKTDPVKLSCVQFLACAVLSTISAFIFENPNLQEILNAMIPILYCGVMSSGIAYTLQVVGQRYTQPAPAAVIMSLESIFAVLAGCLILSETLTIQEWIGCVLVFTAVILAQIPDMLKKKL